MTQTIEHTVLNADHITTQPLLKALVDQAQCPVCQDLMFVPYMTNCGHNFCYGCLTQWLSDNFSCPVCRERVELPYLNLHLQNIVKAFVELTKAQNNGILFKDIARDMAYKLDEYERDVKRNIVFKRMFTNLTRATVDISDGVMRCGNCHWEVDGGSTCPNCHTRLNYSHNGSDSEFEELFGHGGDVALFTDDDSEYSGNSSDDQGEDDSFIDDGEVHILESSDEEGSSRDSSPVRRHRYIPSILNNDAWEDDLSDNLSQDSNEIAEWHGFLSSPSRRTDMIQENSVVIHENSDLTGAEATVLSDSDLEEMVSSNHKRSRRYINSSDSDE